MSERCLPVGIWVLEEENSSPGSGQAASPAPRGPMLGVPSREEAVSPLETGSQ